MRALADEEAHVLLLDQVDLTYEEHLVADRLVQNGYLSSDIYIEDGRQVTDYLITSQGDLALQCYLALKTQFQI